MSYSGIMERRKAMKECKATAEVALVFVHHCVVIILSCCSGIVLGHGIQYPLGASQRDVFYDNHPFQHHWSSSTKERSTRKATESQYYNDNDNDSESKREESLIQITSQLVPPCFNSHCNYSLPTIGSFSPKTSAFPIKNTTKTENTDISSSSSSSSVLQYMPNYKPIRISAFISDKYRVFFTSEEHWNILLVSILQPALTAWSDALHTIPVVNNLTIDTSQLLQPYNYPHYIKNGSNVSTTASSTTTTRSFTSFSSYFCGSNPLSNQAIPQEHISHGVPHTDTVIYVTLGFASDWSYHQKPSSITNTAAPQFNINSAVNSSDTISINSSSGNSQKDLNFAVLVKNETELYQLSSQKSTNANNNQKDYYSDMYDNTTQGQNTFSLPMSNINMISTTDTLIGNDNGSSTNHSNDFSASSTRPSLPTCAFATNILASAEFCNTDQYDRPSVGVLHLCISQDWFHSNDNVEYAAKTVVHEIGHVMGFNSVSMSYMRHPIDGSPRTPRDSRGNVPFSTCTTSHSTTNRNENSTSQVSSSSFKNISTSSTTMIPLPSEDTLRFTTRRNGVRVAEIITETVAMIARSKPCFISFRRFFDFL